ncbi:MAG: glycosyltransferase family 2 protein [Bacteroidia bacterium]
MKDPLLSLVVPLFNEEKLIDILFERTVASMKFISEDFEIICVDDGSNDRTLELLLEKNKVEKRFKVLQLSKNFGHQAAYTAGLNYAKGEFVAMIDGDLQDPPELIKDMHNLMLQKNLDVVFGRRVSRNESMVKRLMIKLFHWIFNKMSNINAPADVGNFSLMNRKALGALISLKEKNRYLPGLRYFIGFNQGYVDYERPDREIGEVKMNFRKLLRLALDAMFSFSKVPIRLCLYLGILGILFSLTGGGIVVIKKILGDAITGWTSILLSIYFLGSVQLLFMGILGEYIHRIFVETQNRPIFLIKEYYE